MSNSAWKRAGTACTIRVPLARDGEPISVAGSTVFTVELFNTAGTPLTVTSHTLIEDNMVLLVSIPAGSNTATTPSSRMLYVSAGDLDIQVPYRISPRIPTAVTSADIINYVGSDIHELADLEFDIIGAYWDLLDQYPSLYATNEIAADKAVLAYCVLQSIPALQTRLVTKSSDGSISYSRQIDWMDLDRRTRTLLDDSLVRSGAIADAVASTLPLGLIVGQRSDPFTGV